MRIRKILFAILLFSSISIHSQDKMEYEQRIKSEKVPEKAIQFIDEALKDYRYKNKWYLEKNEKGFFYEFKSKINGELNSIKFDSLGNIQDVEIITPEKKVPRSSFEPIQKKFENEFTQYKILKIQIQYLGSAKELMQFYKKGYVENRFEELHQDLSDIKVNYEIEVKGKNEKGIHSYEFLFNRKGMYMSDRKIIANTNDHLNY